LGALLVLVLSLAVLATVNLGNTLYQRVRLQSTADSAAYSAAALEARSFNLYAFANRAQASHYVSAMVWQSYDSFIYGTEAFLTDAVGLMASLDACAQPSGTAAAVCAALGAVPGLGQVMAVVDEGLIVLAAAVRSFQLALEASNPDAVIGRLIIPTHQALNEVLASASQAMLDSTLRALESADGAAGVLWANDPDAQVGRELGALNACMLKRAHDSAAGVFPGRTRATFLALDARARRDDDKVARAKRAMATVANASRFACDEDRPSGDCADGFVTRRALDQSLGRLKLGGFVGLPASLLSAIVPEGHDGAPMKYGHTRLLSLDLARGTAPRRVQRGARCLYPNSDEGHPLDNDLRAFRDASGGKGEPAGVLAQGDNLGADDLYVLGIGPVAPLNPFACGPDDDWRRCWGSQRGNDLGQMVKASVWALNPADQVGHGDSIHYRLDRKGVSEDPDNPWAYLGLVRLRHCIGHETCEGRCEGFAWPVYVANVRPMRERHHPWRGMTPFPNFEPGQFLEDCGQPSALPSVSRPSERSAEFNQPSTFIQLHKEPRSVAKGTSVAQLSPSGRLSFGLGERATVDFEDDRPSLNGLAPGLNVLARAQTYYHRPGNWQETPNFFNPYWRPRLAAVFQGRYALPGLDAWLLGLPSPFAHIPQKVMTH
jgi:hypothetical protein